jgi:hypothetical protein
LYRFSSPFKSGSTQSSKFEKVIASGRSINARPFCYTAQKAQIMITHYRTVGFDDLNVYFWEAGSADAPALLLLHGFPTSTSSISAEPHPNLVSFLTS